MSERLPRPGDVTLAALWSVGKGCVFVAVTTVLLLLALRRVRWIPAAAAPGRAARRMPRRMIAAAVLMVLTVLVTAGLSYRWQADSLAASRLADLRVAAQMKGEGVETWLEERRTNIRDFASRPSAISEFLSWQDDRDPKARDRLLDGMRIAAQVNGTASVTLLDPRGEVLLSTEATHSVGERAAVMRSVGAAGESAFIDLHRPEPDAPRQIGFVGPLVAGTGASARIVGEFEFEFSADTFLFPYLDHWPLPSQSAQLLLARRNGDTIEVLNDSALAGSTEARPPITLPLATGDSPMARYFRGQGADFIGTDHRKVSVLETMVPIAGTPWVLGAKESVDEAFVDLRRIALLTGGATALALVAALGFTAAVWQRQRLHGALTEIAQERRIAGLEQRFRETFEQATVGIAHVTLDFAFIRVNPRFCEVLGYDRGEIVGMSARDLLLPDVRPVFDAALNILRTAGPSPRPTERQYLRKDGSAVWLVVTGRIVRGATTEPDYILFFCQDISERKTAEAQLAASEARFRSYTEQAPIGILVADAEASYVDCNPAARELLGYPRGDTAAVTVAGSIAPEDAERGIADFAFLHELGTVRAEYRLKRHDGSLVSVDVNWVKLSGDRYVAYVQDNTARQQAVTELRERLRLRDQIVGIAASVPGVIYAFQRNPDGSSALPFVTSRIEDVFGLTPAEVAGTAEPLLARVHPDDLPNILGDITASARDLSPRHAEYRYDHPAKGERWIETTSQPSVEADGRIVWYGFAADVTDRERDAAALRDASAVLANAGDGIFILDVDGIVTSVNAAFSAITGYDEADVLGRHIDLLRSGRHEEAFYDTLWRSLERTGTWQGEFWVRRKNGDIFPAFSNMSVVHDANGKAVKRVGSIIDISRAKEQESRLERLTDFDPLTRLPNRAGFLPRLEEALERAKRSGKIGAVLFLDLDRFQSINESLGHSSGDEVLQILAERVDTRLRDADTVARLGADEFAILLENLIVPRGAAEVARSLLELVLEPLALSDGREIVIGASIGISLFPAESVAADILMQNADAALFQAKAEGRGVYRFFTAELTRGATERFDMEGRLRRAVERHEFIVHYQPLFSLADRSIEGIEALVRWEDPERGRVPPNQFIGTAEKTGLIVPLGEWVLETACAQMQAWRTAGVTDGFVAVNLSPAQFRQPDLAGRVALVLEKTGLPGTSLELEITEGALIGDTAEAQATLGRLKAMGIRLAIDDFGTGYSSLAYLKKLPIDKLKIDQSFVRDIPHDPADMEIATAIISMARALGLRSLAEGIETEAQFEFLKSRGCEIGQGYLVAKPMSAEDFEAFATRQIDLAASGQPR